MFIFTGNTFQCTKIGTVVENSYTCIIVVIQTNLTRPDKNEHNVIGFLLLWDINVLKTLWKMEHLLIRSKLQTFLSTNVVIIFYLTFNYVFVAFLLDKVRKSRKI